MLVSSRLEELWEKERGQKGWRENSSPSVLPLSPTTDTLQTLPWSLEGLRHPDWCEAPVGRVFYPASSLGSSRQPQPSPGQSCLACLPSCKMREVGETSSGGPIDSHIKYPLKFCPFNFSELFFKLWGTNNLNFSNEGSRPSGWFK